MTYLADEKRYEKMEYPRCGRSGLCLPKVSLGFWHNFGDNCSRDNMKKLMFTAFDLGITHFDLANNYGPPYGEAEHNFGVHMERDWRPHRDELFLSTKAGYDMWPGPYGDGGSRKYLILSLNQSLKRMRVEYVDVFYHHRPDPDTPLEETMGALDAIVRSGKALYAGISNYPPEQAAKAIAILNRLGTPCLIEQPSYSMLNRWIEQGLTGVLRENGVGCIAFAPLQNGILTGKYLRGVPEDSRAARDPRYLKPDRISDAMLSKVARLKPIADARGATLSQLALKWVLRDEAVTSALIGASRPEQIRENVQIAQMPKLTPEELAAIEEALKD